MIGLSPLSAGFSETESSDYRREISLSGRYSIHHYIASQKCSWEVNDLLKLQYGLTEKKERMNTAGFLPTITPGLGRRHQSPLILVC